MTKLVSYETPFSVVHPHVRIPRPEYVAAMREFIRKRFIRMLSELE